MFMPRIRGKCDRLYPFIYSLVDPLVFSLEICLIDFDVYVKLFNKVFDSVSDDGAWGVSQHYVFFS